MADNQQFVQGIDYFLNGSGIGVVDTTIILSSMQYPNGTTDAPAPVLMADFGTSDVGYGTLEPETSREENISFTGITQNLNGTASLTGVTRGLKFKFPYDQDLVLRRQHAGGGKFRISNSVQFYNAFPKGTVTTVSVVHANGITGVVANPTTAPAITLSIDDGSITYSKLQNVTGNRLLGREPGGPGVVEEITLGTNLSLTGTTLNAIGGGSGTVTAVTASAPLASSGGATPDISLGIVDVTHGGTGDTSLTAYAPLFGGTTSTNPVQSGTVGTAGQVLTSNGAGILPTFQVLAGVVTIKSGVASRGMSTASGTQVIAHGLGGMPSFVEVNGNLASNSGNPLVGTTTGTYDGTNMACAFATSIDGQNNTNTSSIITFNTGSSGVGTGSQVATLTMDATNLTFSWTKTGSPLNTGVFLWKVFG